MNIHLKSALKWLYRSVVTLIILLVLAVIWIRVQQPSLKFLDPHIQEAFRPMGPRYQVTYEDIRFAWPRGRLTPGIGITEARCLMNGDTLLARFPSITLRLSISQLLRGRIEPTEIWLSRPRINLSGIGRSAERPAASAGWAIGAMQNPEFLDDLFAFVDRHSAFKRLYATNGRLILPGKEAPVELELPNAVLSMLHVAPTPEFILTVAYQFNGKSGRLQTVIHARPEKGADPAKISESKIQFTNLHPPILAELAPELAFLRGLDFTTDLEMLFRVDASGAVDNLRFEAESTGKGTLFHPEVWEAPIPLDRFTARGWLKNAFSQLKLASLHLESGGTSFDATGTVDNLGKFDSISLDLKVDHLNPAQAHRFWPIRVVPGTRTWIRDHFLDGEIHDAAARIRIQPSDLAAPVLPREILHVKAPFRGVGLKYHSRLQPIEDARGTAVFTAHDITIDVAGAKTYGSEATGGRVVIGNFTAPPAGIDIRTTAKGPADDLRKVIESLTGKPEWIRIGAGSAETRLAFQWPLAHFSEETFDYHAAARILGLEVPDFHGYRWNQKSLLVSLDRNAIAVSGTDGAAAPVSDPKKVIPIQKVEAKGELAYAPAGVTVTSFSADLGGPVLRFSGEVKAAEPFPRLKFDGTVDNLPTDRLLGGWPDRFAPAVKEWIGSHASGGKISHASVRLDLDPEAAATLKALPESAVAVEGAFSGITLAKILSLPSATLEEGTFTLSMDAARIRLASGTLGTSRVTAAKADITGIRKGSPAAEIQADIEGPASELIDAVAALPREKREGLKPPAVTEARARTRARIQFPIRKTIGAADVDYAVETDITDILIQDYLGLTLSSGKASAALANGNFSLEGTIASGKTPVSVTWKREKDQRDTIALKATLDPANHADFRLPPLPFLKGTIPARMDLTVTRAGTEIETRLDLTQPAIDLKRWGWTKKAGARAVLEGRGTLTEGRTLTISRLALSGRNLDIQGTGTATLGEAAALDLQLDPVKAGRHRLTAGVSFEKQQGYMVDLKGSRFDASGFFAGSRPKGKAAEPESPPEAEEPPDSTVRRNTALSFDIKEATLANGITLNQPEGKIHLTGKRVSEAAIQGALNGKAPLQVTVNSRENPGKILITTDDAGLLLKGIDVYRNIRGGKLTFSGRSAHMLPTRKPVTGRVEIRDYYLVNAPGLVKVLSMASFVGALSQLQHGGISFGTLDADLAFENRVITLTNGRMEGISLAMTAEGTYDLGKRMSDIKGIVIPVNILNQMLDMIPVVGKMITGDGIIATDYTIQGPYNDPDVRIKPLTTLSVGFLRTVFKGLHLKAPEDAPAGNASAPAPARRGQ